MTEDLKLLEDRTGRVHIEGISEFTIGSLEEFVLLVARGEENRIKRNTALNESSSRSHSVLEVSLVVEDRTWTMQLCDLAGSEKFSEDQLKSKGHLVESRNINKSLAHLGR